ncbi:DNA primase [Rubricoccus marinus]|uniref:DNA primase n=1 Tax=Rubricoccus marinus TaxID=716817 RepID=A0A259TYD1_9BACT|nr:DNA primase [Rubricoccus marinus]OZC02584.1 DNA primase [Rubricoccus marinus]
MARISDSTIDEVRHASDIVDVISDRVKLKKQGRRFVGLCPFHNEKSPSFSVDPNEGLYYCFGCRRGGDTFKFVQEMEGVGFLDAVRLLADRAGIEIAEEGASPEDDHKASLHAALRFAARFYYEQLSKESGARALEYLKGRGFTPEAIRAFGIGAAPVGWDGLVTAASGAGFSTQILEDVGLAKPRNGGGHYDVFRDRLMFPILSPIGKVLGFGGRILPDTPTASDDYKPAKYINTPETEVYHKSRVLYGMKQAKRDIRTQQEVIVVEGYADVVSLWQAGIQNVVAASGTALTPQQMDGLSRLDVQRVVLLFDADDAGRSAARKGVEVTLDAGLAPYAVSLPDGADPDSFVRQFGADAFRTILRDERMDFVDFLVSGARREGALATPEGTLATAEKVLAAVRRVKNPILLDGYLRRAAQALDVPDADLRQQFEGTSGARAPRPKRQAELPPLAPEAAAPVVVSVRPQEHELLRLMLRHGIMMVEHVLTHMSLEEFAPGPVRQTVELLLEQFHEAKVDPQPFVQGEHGEAIRALVVEAIAERHQASDNWERKMGMEIAGKDPHPLKAANSAMKQLKMARVEEAIEDAKRHLLHAERLGGDTSDLQQQVVELATLRSQIDRGEFLTAA